MYIYTQANCVYMIIYIFMQGKHVYANICKPKYIRNYLFYQNHFDIYIYIYIYAYIYGRNTGM